MDLVTLKKTRASWRRQITKQVKAMTDALETEEEFDYDVMAAMMKQLYDDNVKLQTMDDQILMKLQEEEAANRKGDYDEDADDRESEIDVQIEKARSYQVSVNIVIGKMEKKMAPVRDRPVSPDSSVKSTGGDRFSTAKQYKLPKIQLKKFGGKLSEWLGWWAQFSKIHNDGDLHDVDKFSYLSQSMVHGTRAKELVDSFPMSSENYPEVVQALQDRFGQEDLLIPHYIRELLKIVVKNATSQEKTPLSSLYDKIETDIRALGTLKVTTQEMGRFLHPIVESCLSEDVFMAWQRSPLYEKDGSAEKPPKSKLDYLLQFLKEESKREMKREQAQEGFRWETSETEDPAGKKKKVRKPENFNKDDIPTVAGLSAQGVQERRACIFCGRNNHPSRTCFRANNMALDQKEKFVKENRCCFRCLEVGHRSSACRSNVTCHKCGGKHCDIMCKGPRASNGNWRTGGGGDKTENEEKEELKNENITVSNMGVRCQDDVLLKTVIVKLRNPSTGKETKIRLLFDDASQRSYITKRAANLVMSKPVASEESRIVLMNGEMTDYETVNQHEVMLNALSPASKPVKVLVRERIKIGCPTPKVQMGSWMKEIKKNNIILTDCEETLSCNDIDVLIGSDYYEAFRTGRRIHIQEGLYAVQTVFGWTLSGPIPREKGASSSTIPSYFCGELSKANNYEVALKRLINMTRRLVTHEEYDRYDQIFKSWEEEKIIEVVSEEEEKIGHFLPHRPVIKLESLTTPVRPVFDASCRVGRSPSLNMLLETGPNMLEMIPSLLLKFRRKRIGVLADIRKAFQTISVDDQDRNYQKFLWWKAKDKEVMEYRHCRVVFGMTCSPFILAAVLDHHLTVEGGDAAELLRKSLYVDNCVTSFDQEEEYVQFKEESVNLLLKAQMILRQWETNIEHNLEEPDTSVLGLIWNKKDDTLSIKLPKGIENMDFEFVTSRKVLSIVAQIYDPVGFTCPSVLQPKIMLQTGWLKKKKWDEPWDEEEKNLFLKWMSKMEFLCKIKIPRFAFRPSFENDDELQLHVFCDASQSAYAAVVYIRIKKEEGIFVQLLMAKSRVSPMEKRNGNKKITISRLELLACVIGSRLASTVVESLDFADVPIIFWSDSSTCVAWIQRDEDWGTFVGNRVREITKLTKKENWRHIPGIANPADLPSRGCNSQLLYESSWWEGPVWLKLDPEDWPVSSSARDEDEIIAEKKKTTASNFSQEENKLKFSSYKTNVRIAAWIRRFLNNCRKLIGQSIVNVDYGKIPPLSPDEIRCGERDLLFVVQKRHFGDKPNVKGFMVEKHEDGLWRLKTRLEYSEDTSDFKYPILLPKEDPLVEQLVRYVHEDSFHVGTQHVLNKLRERYWVIHGRSFVKKIIHRCLKCKRYRAEKMMCDPAPLPKKRMESVAAFQTTGVDLAGPLYMKGGKKAWITLYTCATYRCVHLDIVDSLSSEAFLLSLERFVNAVGRPETIYSDNGTNFVGACNMMKKLNWEEIMKKSGTKRIQWIFIPPSAPWWGGWWERLVRSVKEILRKMLGKAKVSYDEMRTCLAAVQNVINDRPLTAVTADSEDLRPLTPSMFMKDLPVEFPEGVELGGKFYEGAYHKIQELRTALQARFRKEYLGFLTSRNLKDGNAAPKVGDLVLVGDSNRKRFEWPLGRILEVIIGKDGKVRVVRVKTSHGILTRPLQRIYPLETYEDDLKKKANHQSESEKEVKVTTRSGRVIEKPQRYGHWYH